MVIEKKIQVVARPGSLLERLLLDGINDMQQKKAAAINDFNTKRNKQLKKIAGSRV